ncbi:hypothetical protein JH06_2461 [Blastocystis sp. subtype 4]|uniref:hypothetical protein n=1 Tax=Blastocystis sp. subtype 4 TaxID=944170 RepID=UPI0007115D67|nr:hypothetical protein JH06_2461 [Blastocystis sp. subtype 4]KNB43688.1 hypothetical protein JH06_2461 [Blastocystis sp. subtype 4]|eukprot:XP_014527131.1 hypothetical protein JH06_2461 [Blastocystis sp. subtype 4]
MSTDVSTDEKDQIRNVCMTLILNNKRLTSKEASRFPNVPYNSIQQIYRATLHELEVQHEAVAKAHISQLITQFDGGMSLESISEKEQLLLPVLLRVFLKCYLNVDSMTAQGYLQNPSLIPNDRLRDTAMRCNFIGASDVLKHDLVRMSSGLEYEYFLKEQLRNQNISFISEATARLEGLSKTPDVVLQFPVSINTDKYP